MKKQLKLGILALSCLGFLGVSGPAAADEITVTSWGGAFSMSQREAYHKPFTRETGITVLEDEWSGDLAQIRVQVETGNYKWHVVDAGTAATVAGCDEGVLEEIDYEKLGGRERFIPGAAFDCGVATSAFGTIYAYDAEIYPKGGLQPTTIADFFDLETFPGKRSMWKNTLSNLEIALIADGVPPGKVNEVLASEGGVDRAFAKLETIKDQIIWWESGSQSVQFLADGEVVMTTAWNGRIYDAVVNEGRDFVIVWDGQGVDFDVWVIPKGHPEKDKAMDFIAFASRPEVMAEQSKYISYGPTVTAAVPLISPEILPHLPTAPENSKNAFTVDVRWWADHVEELNERFYVWLAH
ncbi:MAG: ABC transporter substrate-binding protein [Alphaproteobacteria bacterium]